jgi:uncharacterized protein
VPHYRNLLRLNVGFLINAPVGESREIDFNVPHISWDDDLKLNNLMGTVRMTRTAQGLLAQVRLHATLLTECGRCLTEFQQLLDVDFTELYAFSRSSVTDSGLILPEDGHVDLAPLVREYMLLAIPITTLCKPDCKGLCLECGENLNESDHTHEGDLIDPRLEVLRTLLKK